MKKKWFIYIILCFWLFSRGLERKVRRLEHARGDAKGWYYRPIVDHLSELEQKKAAERSDGFSSMLAPRVLPPPRSWPAPPKTD